MLQEGEDEYLPTIEEDGKLHISKKPKMQKEEDPEESEESEKLSKKELSKREKKEQKRKEKKRRDERNEDEDADLLEDAEPMPLSPGTHVALPSPTEQEKEQKEKHYKDSLTAIAVNCEVVFR